MGFNFRGPDLPLRLAFRLGRIFLISPMGRLARRAGRKYLPSDNQNRLDTTRLTLYLKRLDAAFNGYRLVQISDFHIGTWANRQRLARAIQQVNNLQPDLVAITGDFVTRDPERYEQDLIHLLGSIKAVDGCVAVLGNHDHWSDAKIVRRILKRSGVIELNNATLTIQRRIATLHLAGVDDILMGFDDLESVLTKLPSDGAAILLAHEPDFAARSAASRRFDLQISGHTHGGQVHLPKFGPVVLPQQGRKYPCGLYQVNEMILYTNRGLGTADIQLRYNCPAEITLFELNSDCAELTEQLIGSDRYSIGK
jgi:uncharacterized protein